jgi:hypothetical protein
VAPITITAADTKLVLGSHEERNQVARRTLPTPELGEAKEK